MSACPTVPIIPNNNQCCSTDSALSDQLKRIFGIPDPKNCTGLYYMTYDCKKFGNQSLLQLITTLVNNSIVVNVSPITITSAANVNDPLFDGIKVTQSGSNYVLQLNTYGLNAGNTYTAFNGLNLNGSAFGLGGQLVQNAATLIQGSTGNNTTGIYWGNSTFPITDFWITAKCLTLDVTDMDAFGFPIPLDSGDYVLSRDANKCCVWKQYTNTPITSYTNALSANTGTLRLGGALSLPMTTIDGLTTNSVEFININSYRIATQILTLQVAGTVGAPGTVLMSNGVSHSWQAIPVIPPLVYSGTNGINVAGTLIKMGGTLVDALTAVNGLGTQNYTFQDIAILDLQGERLQFRSHGLYGNLGDVPVATGTGDWNWLPIVIPAGTVTADNGLTVNTGNNVRLGGTLSISTTIAGTGVEAFNFNNISAFRIEAVTSLQFTIAGSNGTLGQVLTSGGTFATWQDPQFGLLPHITTPLAIYPVLATDGNVILLTVDAIATLPAVIDKKIYVVTVKNAGVNNRITPVGTDEIHDSTTIYNVGVPYVIAANAIVWVQGVITGGINFWQIISK